jgi:bifunctional UDP-N-acetylglucosamine pyrophosphorylase/glucosamine-1-phosphate N-acetyltransferase
MICAKNILNFLKMIQFISNYFFSYKPTIFDAFFAYHQKKEYEKMKNTVQAIILAAGKSTRLNTEKTKLAEPICGQPMILFSTKLLESLNIDTTVIVGHEKATLQSIISHCHEDKITYALQKEQLGTGHALACSQHLWNKENILVINGDMPLVTENTLIELFKKHTENNATVSFVSSCTEDKTLSKGYGRIITTDNTIEIIEAKDFIGNPSEYCCINAGIYLIKKEFLVNYIQMLNNSNASNEFYITDLIKIASENDKPVTKISAPFDTIRGINTMEELITAEHIKQSELISYWMNQGVRFASHQTMRIDLDVTIGQGSFIGENVHLLGKTFVGNNVYIHPFSIIKDCLIEPNTEIGPFVYIKNNNFIKPHYCFKNTIETKDNTFNQNIKVKHILKKEDSSTLQTSSDFSFIGARLVHHDIPSDEQ